MGIAHEGAGSLQRAELTRDLIERLDSALIVSGHGPVVTDPAVAIARARARFAAWAADSEMCVVHAAKRIFAYRLMLQPISRQLLP